MTGCTGPTQTRTCPRCGAAVEELVPVIVWRPKVPWETWWSCLPCNRVLGRAMARWPSAMELGLRMTKADMERLHRAFQRTPKGHRLSYEGSFLAGEYAGDPGPEALARLARWSYRGLTAFWRYARRCRRAGAVLRQLTAPGGGGW